MEQYCHLLIPSDPDFVPEPATIEKFFDLFVGSFGFQIVLTPPIQPGFMLLTPSETPRVIRNVYTGETIFVPSLDRTVLSSAASIPAVIESERHWIVRLSGKWLSGHSPISLRTTDRVPFEGELVCFIECDLRPAPVCTSDCWDESHPDQAALSFDDPNGPKLPLGIFTNPWTGRTIEVPGAGFARFWVSFEFGKFIFPDLAGGFDLLQPQFLDSIQECFGMHFVQAGRLL